MKNWWLFHGTSKPHAWKLPPAPPWRRTNQAEPLERTLDRADEARGRAYQFDPEDEVERDLVNAALLLRRPLLITGKPGSGKSSLAYAVAHELALGPVLVWPINTRSTLQEGLYKYDAIARLQAASLAGSRPRTKGRAKPRASAPDVGQFIRLGPLGTALLPAKLPRVLLIDEFDKSDVDLPNDLLHVLEESWFDIDELRRERPNQDTSVWTADNDMVPVPGGRVFCREFPLVLITSNGEREFPPAFLRRCLRYDMPEHGPKKLAAVVEAQLKKFLDGAGEQAVSGTATKRREKVETLIDMFLEKRKAPSELATDQLLNAVYLTTQQVDVNGKDALSAALFRTLGDAGTS